jgi:peptidoglycan glycosyltransferase
VKRQLKALGAAIVVCYALLFLKLNQVQVLQADAYNSRPENTRALQRDFNQPRGDIRTADDVVIARSVERRAALRFQREYPQDDLFAHVTGYYSFTLGSDGVERSYNEELAGRTPSLELHELSGFLTDTSSAGNVVLTVRSDVQAAARAALGDRKGSVVALDPRSGAVLALWSWPSYDPNVVSSNDGDLAADAKTLLDASPDKPLLAKSYRETFFPGSTFKVVTAAAGLTSGRVTQDSPSYPVVSQYVPPGTSRPISNSGGAACGGTLPTILARSCNTSFAEMAAEDLGPDPMITGAESVGFNATPPIDLPRAVPSRYPTDYGEVVQEPEGSAPIHEDTARLAQTAIGQNDVRATPLQMALVAAAVADGGRVMRPHVMDRVEAQDGTVVETYEPRAWRTGMPAPVAEQLRTDMIGVVTGGTARRLRIEGVEVGAKTGTAQLGTSPPTSHGWMIAFAGPPGQPAEVAVAVIVEGIDGTGEETGASSAGPVARAVIEAALGGA